jgi:hypothetical protein
MIPGSDNVHVFVDDDDDEEVSPTAVVSDVI